MMVLLSFLLFWLAFFVCLACLIACGCSVFAQDFEKAQLREST